MNCITVLARRREEGMRQSLQRPTRNKYVILMIHEILLITNGLKPKQTRVVEDDLK